MRRIRLGDRWCHLPSARLRLLARIELATSREFEWTNMLGSVVQSTPASILEQPLGDRDFRLPAVGDNHRQNWLIAFARGKGPSPTWKSAPAALRFVSSATSTTSFAVLCAGIPSPRYSATTTRPRSREIESPGIASDLATFEWVSACVFTRFVKIMRPLGLSKSPSPCRSDPITIRSLA